MTVLYGAEVSLYSGKARAYLCYKQVPFEERLPTASVIRDVIVPRTGLAMVPVVIDDDDVAVGDTSVIIDHFEAKVPERPVIPSTPRQRFVSHALELYADEWLLLPAMHYRWAYPRHHAWFVLREFGALVAPDRPRWQQPLVGLPVFLYFGLGHGRVLGIDRRTRREIERTYERFLGWFDAHLAVHPYVLGGRPTLADFGLLAPLYAHLYRDPYSGQLMRRLAPRVADWVERMNAPEAQVFGDLVSDDQIPETLLPLLRHAFEEHWAVIDDTWAAIEAWIEANPDARKLPRFVGRHAFRVGRARSTRAVFSYTAWMSQRTLQAAKAEGVTELLDEIGASASMARPHPVLGRRRGRILPP